MEMSVIRYGTRSKSGVPTTGPCKYCSLLGTVIEAKSKKGNTGKGRVSGTHSLGPGSLVPVCSNTGPKCLPTHVSRFIVFRCFRVPRISNLGVTTFIAPKL